MCGIAGIWNYGSGRPVIEPDLKYLTDRLSHRGPDDEGFWHQGDVGLGFRRLSIIDLVGGHQPMSNETGTIWLVFNGEIYNFQSLRADLVRRGHHFATRSDSEVIIHAYEEYGLSWLSLLDGMFAFALWDGNARRLILARDRLGKKPLVYAHTPEGVTFASEVQALVGAHGVSQEIRVQSIADYLRLQYIPTPDAIFENMGKLPPAHFMVLENGQTRVAPYWELRYEPDESLSDEDAAGLVRQSVEDAVRKRLISDVPLGAFLSGGIDSTIVVGTMARLSNSPVETFSIGFTDEQVNELPMARLVAERFHTNHHEFVVQPQMADVLPKLAAHYGEPFGDPSALPTYYLAQQTRQFVTVALSGDGGDELFAGYYRHTAGMKSARWDRTPQSARRAAKWVAENLPPSVGNLDAARRFRIVAGSTTLDDRYRTWSVSNSTMNWDDIASGDLLASLRGSDSYARVIQPWFHSGRASDPLNQMLLADTMTFLPHDVLVKVDIASMANSLEVRCPLLDHHFVELVARLPVRMKLRHGTSKYILRRAFADLMPPPVLTAPKQGFVIPLQRWLRGELHDVTHDLVLSGALVQRGYVDRSRMQRMLGELDAGVDYHAGLVWAVLMLELWHREVLDRARTQVNV